MGFVKDVIKTVSGVDLVGDIVGDLTGSNAATKGAQSAAAAQEAAAREANQLARDVHTQGRTDQLPWLAAGQGALNPLLALTGLPQVTNAQIQALSAGPLGSSTAGQATGTGTTPAGAVPSKPLPAPTAQTPVPGTALTTAPTDINQLLTVNPAYQWNLDQGQKALERSAAARGGLVSGGFAKDLTNYAQGAASNEYNNIWNRYANIAGVGQTTAQNLGGQGQNYATQAAQNLGDIGNARASGYVAAGNQRTNNFNQLLNVGTAAAYAFSDRRLKTDVVRVGTHASGLPLYEYTIFGRRERGVMADEAQKLRPDAVMEGPDGYLLVNYGAL